MVMEVYERDAKCLKINKQCMIHVSDICWIYQEVIKRTTESPGQIVSNCSTQIPLALLSRYWCSRWIITFQCLISQHLRKLVALEGRWMTHWWLNLVSRSLVVSWPALNYSCQPQKNLVSREIQRPSGMATEITKIRSSDDRFWVKWEDDRASRVNIRDVT